MKLSSPGGATQAGADRCKVRAVNRVILVLPMATFAHADVLGLWFGMTADEVMALKLGDGPVLVPAKAELKYRNVAYAGTAMNLVLWIPQAGLRRIGLSRSLGSVRQDAEREANSILSRFIKEHGPVAAVAGGEQLQELAALFDNVDRVAERFRGMNSAAMFQVEQPPANTYVGGKVLRSSNRYWIELAFTKQ